MERALAAIIKLWGRQSSWIWRCLAHLQNSLERRIAEGSIGHRPLCRRCSAITRESVLHFTVLATVAEINGQPDNEPHDEPQLRHRRQSDDQRSREQDR